jgi:hypothetical protein
MTKKFLDPTLQIAQTIKLTPELVMRLNLGAIVYGEQTRLGGMGNAGGVILYAAEEGHLTRYETSYYEDETAWSDVRTRIDDNEALFDFYSGGMGNGVFIKKGISFTIKHYTSEARRLDSHFVYQQGGVRYRIFSSVYGVFRNVARALTEGGMNNGN